MRFWLGVLAGIGAAWAALAIWQQVPPLAAIVWEDDDIDPDDVPPVEPWPPLRGERDDVHLRHKFPAPPVTDPGAFMRVGAP